MATDRVAALERMAQKRPDDVRLRFGLALEYLAAGREEEGVRELRAYLEAADDEGNAWGRLGAVLQRSGRDEEAKQAYLRGIEAAYRHGHPTMAAEFEAVLEEWDA
jgi:E3 SUMO-protein ligase RanBP2